MALTPLRQSFRCDHCHAMGTTGEGGLWKTEPGIHASLYYLHSRCLLPYKAAHNLQSVEGRLPKRERRLSVVNRPKSAQRYRGVGA